MKCRECGGRIVLAPEGYYVCEHCGLIQDDIIVYSTEEEKKLREERSIIGTYIFVHDIHSNIFRKIAMNNIHITYNLKNITIKRVETIVKSLAPRLNLTENECRNINHTVISLAPKWRKDEYAPSSVNGLIAATVYVELSRRGSPPSVKDIVDAFRNIGRRLSYGELLYALHFLRKNGLQPKTDISTASKYIISLLVRCGIGINEIASLEPEIERLLLIGKRTPGIRSRSLYSAIAYIIASKKRKISYREFCRKTGIPLSTLRENVGRLRRLSKETLFVRQP